MKMSRMFFKTRKETPADADSINASYLIRAGFIEKQMAGVYALLPLGFRVYKKIEAIIREEMNAIGAEELLMNVLQPEDLWKETGRHESAVDILFKFKDNRDKVNILAPTHEEQIVDIVRKKVNSYKDLPVALYQIQTKFRNEARVKSGLLRGREFIMKDLYSFHTDQEDFARYYEIAKGAYAKIFSRLGLDAKLTEASGGIFSKYSHEYQVLNPAGEDTIFACDKCDFSQNNEVAEVKAGDKCPKCDGVISESSGIEVGNIFPLSTKFSEPMKATVTDKDGKLSPMIMGCYGIGLTRILATIVEVYYNTTTNKMVWPKSTSPFDIQIVSLGKSEESEKLYDELSKKYDVLLDDREMSNGEKFAESDLLGIPTKIIVSEKSLAAGGYEVVGADGEKKILSKEEVFNITI